MAISQVLEQLSVLACRTCLSRNEDLRSEAIMPDPRLSASMNE
jgi:hypothetical protein